MRSGAWVLVVCAAGCGTSTPVTASGTVLVDWDVTKSSRTDLAKATVGEHTSKDYTLTVSPKGAPTFKVAAHVETAPVDYTELEPEGPKSIHQVSPVAIKVTVKENSGWDLSGKCLDGPNYQMPTKGADGKLVTPQGMIQDCQINEHRQAGAVFKSSWDIGFTLNVHGDGTIDAFPPEEVKID